MIEQPSKDRTKVLTFYGEVALHEGQAKTSHDVQVKTGQSSEAKSHHSPSKAADVPHDELAQADRETKMEVMPLPKEPKPSASPSSPRRRGRRALPPSN